MIFPDKKKAATIILSRIKPGGEQSSGPAVKNEESISDKDQSLQAICEDMISALHDKSATGLASAMKAFLANHSDSDQDGE